MMLLERGASCDRDGFSSLQFRITDFVLLFCFILVKPQTPVFVPSSGAGRTET